MKELRSGIKVEAETYYKLLDFKDRNMHQFTCFVMAQDIPRSINNCTLEQYNRLLTLIK